MDPIIIISCDEHTGPPLEAYRPYLDSKYHRRLDEQKAVSDAKLAFLKRVASVRPHQYGIADHENALRNGGEDGAWDPKRRLEEMDREGVVWGQAHPVANDSKTFNVPPFPSSTEDYALWGRYTADEQIAGARAHNRWMADFKDATDGRVDACALIGPCGDIDQAVAELHWLATRGFGTVTLPPPPLDRRYDPFWAACQDLGLVLAAHAGWDGSGGAEMGSSGRRGGSHGRVPTLPQEQVEAAVAAGLDLSKLSSLKGSPNATQFLGAAYEQFADLGRDFSAPDIEVANVAAGNSTFDLNVKARGPIWQLLLSGALDRFPGLKITFTEIRSDWVPATLAHLDGRFAKIDRPLKMKPSDYFRRNFRVAASFIRPLEVQMRHEIGVDQLMFGRDYPHPEGTWPNTYDWIRGAFRGVPENEARAILGENAIKWFGLDRAKLAKIAERIGPSPKDLLGDQRVDPRKISFFHRLSNYNRPLIPVDPAELDAVIDEAMEYC